MLTSAMTGPLHVKQTHLKAKDGAALSGDASRVSRTDYIRWGPSHHPEKEQWGHRNTHKKQQEAIGLRANTGGHRERRGRHRQGCLQQPRSWRWTSHLQVRQVSGARLRRENKTQSWALCSCTRWSMFTAEKLDPQGLEAERNKEMSGHDSAHGSWPQRALNSGDPQRVGHQSGPWRCTVAEESQL